MFRRLPLLLAVALAAGEGLAEATALANIAAGGLLLLFVYASLELNTLLFWKLREFQGGGLSVLWAPDHMSAERRRSVLDWFAEAGYQAQRLASRVIPIVLSYRSDADAAWVAVEFLFAIAQGVLIWAGSKCVAGAWAFRRLHLSES